MFVRLTSSRESISLASVKFVRFISILERPSMAMKITDECIACGACLPECPTESISEGDIYVIDANTCVECEGYYDSPQCVSVCPVECIIKA